jgi:glycosyltransferase involved in cell wall biosynthesis
MKESSVSVIIPLYNEEDNVAALYSELASVMRAADGGREFELIFVDDGSRDRTLENLLAASKGDPAVQVIQFRRNFGQTAAMAAGLEHARNEIVITMDGDLQNDPHEIPKLIAKVEEGYDLVAGWRKDRQDKWLSRRLPSKIANWIISRTTKVQLHDYGCSLKAMTSEVAKGIKLYGEMHRFIPALAEEMGARIAEVPVKHRARIHGTSKYGISRTIRVVLDLLTVKFLLSFSKRPIHFFGSVGMLTAGLGGATLTWLTYQRMFQDVPMGNRPLLALSVMLVMIGVQFIVFGLLAEVLARTYYESQNKPTYRVKRYFGSLAEEASRFADQQDAAFAARDGTTGSFAVTQNVVAWTKRVASRAR